MLLSEVLNISSPVNDDTAFTIQCQYRNYECFAPNQRERDGWVEALQSAAEREAERERHTEGNALDPLGLLDELVTVVEPSFTKHVDSVTSSFASLRESLMMSHQRAAVKAAGLEAARDDADSMRLKIKQLEGARAQAEARASAAEQLAQRQGAQLDSLNEKLRVVGSAAVGLQCVIDQSRAQLVDLRKLLAGEASPEEVRSLPASFPRFLSCSLSVLSFVKALCVLFAGDGPGEQPATLCAVHLDVHRLHGKNCHGTVRPHGSDGVRTGACGGSGGGGGGGGVCVRERACLGLCDCLSLTV